MSAFPAAAQRAFRINCGNLIAAAARLANGTCLLWARCRHATRNYWLTASKHTMSRVRSIHLKCRESLRPNDGRFWIARVVEDAALQ